MTTGVIRSQGTEVFVVDTTTTTDPTVVKLSCPTGVSGLGGAADQIQDTCLDTTGDKTYLRGLGNPGQVSIPFNLIPRESSHQLLLTLKDAGTVCPWIVCLSESATDPTVDSDGLFVAPVDRTSFAFNAYISDVNIDVATNEIVRGTITLQRSGTITATWYTP